MSLWQSCKKDHETQGSYELPWLSILHAYCHTWLPESNAIHKSTGRGQMEVLALELSCTPSCASRLLADFNLYLFNIINHNFQCYGIQWVPWLLLVNSWNWGWSWRLCSHIVYELIGISISLLQMGGGSTEMLSKLLTVIQRVSSESASGSNHNCPQ